MSLVTPARAHKGVGPAQAARTMVIEARRGQKKGDGHPPPILQPSERHGCHRLHGAAVDHIQEERGRV